MRKLAFRPETATKWVIQKHGEAWMALPPCTPNFDGVQPRAGTFAMAVQYMDRINRRIQMANRVGLRRRNGGRANAAR
jgi:hypothetical protein